MTIELSDEQVTCARAIWDDALTNREGMEKLVAYFQPLLQSPIAEPTQKELNQFADDFVYAQGSTRESCVEAFKRLLTRRNAPAPVDPRREKIIQVFRTLTTPGGVAMYEDVADKTLAALDEVPK